MHGLNTNSAPHQSVVIPHFIFGAISLLVLALMILLADQDLLAAYFNSKMIAITHMAVLGWATMIIFGALYQLIPVVFETSLYSEKLAKITFWSSVGSILFLTYAFWVGAFSTLLIYAAIWMFISLLMFVVNVGLTYRKAALRNIKSQFILSAVLWLAVTELIGTLIALNFKFGFFSEIHLHYLKIHATIGLIGWFLMLIIGVGSTLIPMFLISHKLNEKKIVKTFYLVNTGLVLFLLNWFFMHMEWISYLASMCTATGVLYFISFIRDSYKKRLRKKLDIGMQYTMLAIGVMLLPVLVSAVLFYGFKFDIEVLNRITTLYGFSIIFGIITTLILGQTYKTLPFIVWLYKYKKLVGKIKTPLPKELYSDAIAKAQFVCYLIFVLGIVAGLLINNMALIRIASYALLIVAVLYALNLFKIILHKVKSQEHE